MADRATLRVAGRLWLSWRSAPACTAAFQQYSLEHSRGASSHAQVVHQTQGPARHYDSSDTGSRGVKDGIGVVLRDHEEIRDAVRSYKQQSSPGAKLDAARRMVYLASTHSSIEDRYVYPLIKTHLGELSGEMLYDRFIREDFMLKQALDFVDRHTCATLTQKEMEYFDASALQLCEMLDEHLSSEERFVLNPLKGKMSAEESARLFDDFNSGKDTAVTHPHPGAPITGSRILHPLTAAVDKAWDAVADKSSGSKAAVQQMDGAQRQQQQQN